MEVAEGGSRLSRYPIGSYQGFFGRLFVKCYEDNHLLIKWDFPFEDASGSASDASGPGLPQATASRDMIKRSRAY